MNANLSSPTRNRNSRCVFGKLQDLQPTLTRLQRTVAGRIAIFQWHPLQSTLENDTAARAVRKGADPALAEDRRFILSYRSTISRPTPLIRVKARADRHGYALSSPNVPTGEVGNAGKHGPPVLRTRRSTWCTCKRPRPRCPSRGRGTSRRRLARIGLHRLWMQQYAETLPRVAHFAQNLNRDEP